MWVITILLSTQPGLWLEPANHTHSPEEGLLTIRMKHSDTKKEAASVQTPLFLGLSRPAGKIHCFLHLVLSHQISKHRQTNVQMPTQMTKLPILNYDTFKTS